MTRPRPVPLSLVALACGAIISAVIAIDPFTPGAHPPAPGEDVSQIAAICNAPPAHPGASALADAAAPAVPPADGPCR